MGLKERRDREKLQRREEILSAARTLLLEDGLQHTSVNKISKRAELSIGSIYFYFKNKEEIFAALEMEGLEILHTYIRTATDNITDVEEKLRQGAYAYYQFSLEQKDYFDVINYFLSSPEIYFSGDVNRNINSRGAAILTDIETMIIEGNEQGLFQENSPGSFAVFFWASLHGLVLLKKLRGTIIDQENYPSFFKYSVEQLINSIRRKQ